MYILAFPCHINILKTAEIFNFSYTVLTNMYCHTIIKVFSYMLMEPMNFVLKKKMHPLKYNAFALEWGLSMRMSDSHIKQVLVDGITHT